MQLFDEAIGSGQLSKPSSVSAFGQKRTAANGRRNLPTRSIVQADTELDAPALPRAGTTRKWPHQPKLPPILCVKRDTIVLRKPVSRRELLTSAGGVSACLLFPQFIAAASKGSAHGLDALLQRYVDEGRIAGAVAAVGSQKRSLFVAAGRISLSDDAALADPDSLWRIYSMTKLVTGAAAMLLIEDGKLRLDSPVADIFSSFASPRVLSGAASETRSAGATMTVRHLMTHTAGFVGSMVPEPPLSVFYASRKLNVSRVSLDEDDKVEHQSSLLAYAEQAGTVPLAFDPGTSWSYGISSDVLGGCIEKVAGVPFAQFLEERIFRPLRMNDTAFHVSRDKLNRLTTNYQVSPDGLQVIDAPPHSIFGREPPFPYPSSGLVSSARDFSHFMGMLLGEGTLNGTRVMSTHTARTMMSNLLPTGVTAMGQGWGAGGLVLLHPRPEQTGFGGVQGTYGWQGGAGTLSWVDRVSGIYAVLMTQYMPTEAYSLPSEFLAATDAAASDLR